ncbi:MAG: hypothetical protein JWL70_1406 [Acidimicrobiia bacterium]|nr:hypothetical protein [Acidimicrobiia bacterium]
MLASVPAVLGRRKATPSVGYVPALDGLRALAVAVVLAFHQGFAWASGGYLGVSLFFTLSGFLIASLLLQEHSSTGRIQLGQFWARRARRILPVALLGIAGVWIALTWIQFGSVTAIRLDALAALAYGLNWRLLFGHQSYDQLFSGPSPLLHYWSLAIEEQFYLLIAPLFVVVLRRRPASLLAVCGALYATGAAVSLVAGRQRHTDFVYYSTVTRMPELMIGVIAAVLVQRRRSGTVTWQCRRPMVLNLASVMAMAALAVAVALLIPNDIFLDRGGLLLVSLGSVTLVLAATAPGTWLAGALARGPLPFVGRLSYALYVVHWPVFLILDSARTGWNGASLFAMRVGASVLLALVVTAAVEAPVRRRLRTPRTIAWVAVPLTAALAVLLVVGPEPSSPPSPSALIAAAPFASTASAGVVAAAVPAPVPASPVAPAPVVRSSPLLAAGMFGDSTSIATAWGLSGWGVDTGRFHFVGGVSQLDCGLGRGGQHRYQGRLGAERPQCDWSTVWKAEVQAHPEMRVAVIQLGPRDVSDRRLAGDSKWRHIGDPIYDRYLLGEMNGALDMFTSLGVQVVWLTAPDIEVGRADVPPPAHPYPESDPARMRRFNDLMRQAAAGRPAVHVVDLAAHLAELPGGEMDARLRPDGVHFTLVTTREVADWLGPALEEATSGAG